MITFQTIKDYTVVDIETTGLSYNNDEIIEIGALKIRDDQIVDQFEVLIKPSQPVSYFITNLTGITNEMLLQKGISIKEALLQYHDFVGNDIICGHNVSFDINFINNKFQKTFKYNYKPTTLDTMSIARRVVLCENYKLKTLCAHFNITQRNAHRALDDVSSTHQVLLALKKSMINE